MKSSERCFPRPSESAAAFTRRVRPSNVSRFDCQWIQTECPVGIAGVRRSNRCCASSSAEEIRNIIDQYRVANFTNSPPWHQVTAAAKAEVFRKVYSTAISKQDTCGKWMLFIEPWRADEVWEKVAAAVEAGRLGESAKIAPCAGMSPSERVLVCIYCADFSDRGDCMRVLRGIKQLGLQVSSAFKADALTYVGLDNSTMMPLQLKTSWQLHLDLLHDVFPPGNWPGKPGLRGFDMALLRSPSSGEESVPMDVQ